MATENEDDFCVELVGCGMKEHPATHRVTWDDGRPSIVACRAGAFHVASDLDSKVTIEQIDKRCACGGPAEYKQTNTDRNLTYIWYVCCGAPASKIRERL